MRKNIIAALAAAFVTLSFAASAAQLLPPASHDQVPGKLVSLAAPAGRFEHAAVSFSWPLDPGAALSTPPAFAAESREYWQTVDDTELRNGVTLRTSAPGALIRISPAHGAASLDANALEAVVVDGPGRGRKARLEHAASADALRAAGMDVATGTAVVKLARENGAGAYSLHAAQARGRYVVHVFEPESDVVLTARPDRSHVLGGDTLSVAIGLSRGGNTVPAQAQGLLVAPDGSSRTVAIARGANGQLSARFKLPESASAAPGLWELQVFATGDGLSRDARTAFAVAAPTARLDGEVTVDRSQLRASIPLHNASPGRYELRGTLYATAADGTLAPVSQAHSAAWFERGDNALVLRFDRAHVPAGFGAPYEIRQLELHDQSRMAPLETRSRAVRF